MAVTAEPAGGEYLQRALAPLVLLYGLGEQASSPAFWRIYNEVLSGYPRMAIDRAIKVWQAEGKFFPKPAELNELAKPHADAVRQAIHRSNAAQEDPKAEVSKRDQRTPESIAQVGSMLAAYTKMIQTKRPPEIKRLPVRGPVDRDGVTAEGRALIERMKEMG